MSCTSYKYTLGVNFLLPLQAIHYTPKLDVPNLVTDLNHAPMFEWYVVWCGFKNEYRKGTCARKIGLRVQNMITILGLVINVVGETYMTIQ